MRRQNGFAYLFLLYAIALGSIALLAVGALEHCARVRAREVQLLREGHAFRRALRSYYQSVQPHVYPATLDELLLDRRNGVPRRHLRKIYVDPMTRDREWGLVREAGRIVGVHSLSDRRPMKMAGFDIEDVGFDDAQHYSDWVFSPLRVPAVAASSSTPVRLR